MRRIGGFLFIVLLLGGAPAPESAGLVGPSPAAAVEDVEAVRQKFEAFVATWLEKLRERERHNATQVKWQNVAGRYEGYYVGYDTANFRILPLTNVEVMPIGKLVYLELKFRLSGDSEEAARGGPPEVVERVEVTELFRYDRGKWVY